MSDKSVNGTENTENTKKASRVKNLQTKKEST